MMKYAVTIVGIGAILIVAATLLTQTRLETVSAAEAEFVAATQCKLCHNKPDEGQQFTAWENMRHSHAFETLKSDAALAIAKEKGLTDPPSESVECLQCHVTGYDVATKSAPKGIEHVAGIQCDSCHGPGSAHLADGKTLRMNKDAVIDVKANLATIDANTCTKCHNESSPTWKPEQYTLESGEKVGFDFKQAVEKIAHMNPKKASAQ